MPFLRLPPSLPAPPCCGIEQSSTGTRGKRLFVRRCRNLLFRGETRREIELALDPVFAVAGGPFSSFFAEQVVLGQGYPVVSSRFQDPNDLNNSYWSPESVPSVKAQSWAANYRDGLCGIRVMGEGIDEDDPGLSER